MQNFEILNKKFDRLFNQQVENEGVTGNRTHEFQKSFGWIYNCKMVAEFEGLSMNETWELPIIQFLNDLTYIKIKGEMEAEQERKLLAKYKK